MIETTHSSSVVFGGRLNCGAFITASFIDFPSKMNIGLSVYTVPLRDEYEHQQRRDIGDIAYAKYEHLLSFLARSSASFLTANIVFVMGRLAQRAFGQRMVKFSCMYPVPS